MNEKNKQSIPEFKLDDFFKSQEQLDDDKKKEFLEIILNSAGLIIFPFLWRQNTKAFLSFIVSYEEIVSFIYAPNILFSLSSIINTKFF